MLEVLIPVATFLTQFFSGKLLEWGLDRVRLSKVTEKLNEKIQIVLQESIMDFPDGKYIVENFNLVGYFQNPTVQSELSLLIQPNDVREPDIKLLQDIWQRKLGNQLPGNYKLIIHKFISALREKLWEIEEIREQLHYKDQRISSVQIKENTQEILDELRRLIGNNLGLADTNTIHGINFPAPDSVPLPSAPFLVQENLVQTLLTELSSFPWLALIDGPGKGKTQLAAAVAKIGFHQIKWISLRNKDQQTNSHFRDQLALWLVEFKKDRSYWDQYLSGLSLERIIEYVAEFSGLNSVLVIDDLPDPVEFEDFYLELEIVAQILISRNIKIITTSQRTFPPFVDNRFRPLITKKSRPSFSSNDILSLLRQESAPDPFLKEGIATWIVAMTKGHPSLVAATIKWLEQSNWDYSLTTIDGLITGEPVKETLEFSRRHLIRQLSELQKELLYRFSVVWDSFTRETALEIANINPKITKPGVVLDYLIGPWLDQLENHEYNVTPLLANSGTENLDFEVQQAVHRLLIKQITSDKVIEINKVNSLLLHLWQAQDYLEFGQALLQAMMSVKTVSQAKYIDWTTGLLLDTRWPDEIDLNLRLLIRAAQIRVAVMASKKFFRLNADLEILIKQANPEDNLFSLIGVHTITGVITRNLPAELAISHSFSLLRLYTAYHDGLNDNFEADLFESLPVLIWGQGLLAKNPSHTYMFLEELSKLSIQEKEFLFTKTIPLEVSEHLMTLIPFTESNLSTNDQNWNSVLTKLDELSVHSVVQENLYLKFACARARSIVFADYLHDIGQAIKILDAFSDILDPDIVFFLNYAKGCYFSSDGQTDRAITCFDNAEHSLGNEPRYYRVDNVRRLAIEKSKNKEWINAKELCIATIRKFKAMQLEGSTLFIWDVAEILGELAFIYWNLGEFKKLSTSFYGYVMKLVEHEDVNDLRYKEAFNKAGHGLGWFLMILTTGSPPSQTLEGEVYAPVTAGLFGVRRENLGTVEPPLGFSKALLLNQIGRTLYIAGLEKLAWHANKIALSYYQSENQEHHFGLTLVYPDIAVLEMIYGDESLALSYALLVVKFLASAQKQAGDESKAVIDLSLAAEDDLKTVERHLLYMFFIPVLLNCLSLRFSEDQINQKMSAIEDWFDINKNKIFYPDEWMKVIKYFRDLINYRNTKIKPDLNFDVFGDRTTFQILWLFVSSLYERIPLKESFTNQVRALDGLNMYKSFCMRMLPGFGRLLHQYWLNVSKTQRFALHDPRGFADLMNAIPPSLGGRTIIKVIKAVSTALQITIPTDVMQNLEGLIFI